MKFDQDLCLNLQYDFGKMNSTLGSVVPLAMFFYFLLSPFSSDIPGGYQDKATTPAPALTTISMCAANVTGSLDENLLETILYLMKGTDLEL